VTSRANSLRKPAIFRHPAGGAQFDRLRSARGSCVLTTIFVVDDDPALTRVLHDELSGRHRLVRVFSDPLRALSALASEHADLLITDLSMPWVDGRDVVAAARHRQPGLKIVLMSGYPRGAQIAACEHIRFLQKPIDLDGLLTTIDEAFDGTSARPALGD
jgi:DNA-binding NtrC family response regulator